MTQYVILHTMLKFSFLSLFINKTMSGRRPRKTERPEMVCRTHGNDFMTVTMMTRLPAYAATKYLTNPRLRRNGFGVYELLQMGSY